jgi:hypothetical protein
MVRFHSEWEEFRAFVPFGPHTHPQNPQHPPSWCLPSSCLLGTIIWCDDDAQVGCQLKLDTDPGNNCNRYFNANCGDNAVYEDWNGQFVECGGTGITTCDQYGRFQSRRRRARMMRAANATRPSSSSPPSPHAPVPTGPEGRTPSSKDAGIA